MRSLKNSENDQNNATQRKLTEFEKNSRLAAIRSSAIEKYPNGGLNFRHMLQRATQLLDEETTQEYTPVFKDKIEILQRFIRLQSSYSDSRYTGNENHAITLAVIRISYFEPENMSEELIYSQICKEFANPDLFSVLFGIRMQRDNFDTDNLLLDNYGISDGDYTLEEDQNSIDANLLDLEKYEELLRQIPDIEITRPFQNDSLLILKRNPLPLTPDLEQEHLEGKNYQSIIIKGRSVGSIEIPGYTVVGKNTTNQNTTF